MGQRAQELLLEVGREELGASRCRIIHPVATRPAHAEHDELDSGGPPLELIDHGSAIGAIGELAQEGVGLVGGEEQVCGLDRIQPPGELEPRGADPRCGSTRQHDPARRRNRLDDSVENVCGTGVGDEVDVVENEDERSSDVQLFVELSERSLCRHGPDVAGDAQEPGVGHDRVERRQDSAEQPDGVVVAAVERQPCGLAVEAIAPPSQQRRLAVAGARGDEHDGSMRSVEALEETIASQRSVVRARRGESVRCDTELGG